MRNTFCQLRSDKLEDIRAVGLIHLVSTHLRRNNQWHLSEEIHHIVIIDSTKGSQFIYIFSILRMFTQVLVESVDRRIGKTDDTIQVVPHIVILAYRRLKVVEEDILPGSTIYPVTLATRNHTGIRRELLEGVYRATIASIQSISNGRIYVSHCVYIYQLRGTESLLLRKLASWSLIQ